jgi:hypothetical protein
VVWAAWAWACNSPCQHPLHENARLWPGVFLFCDQFLRPMNDLGLSRGAFSIGVRENTDIGKLRLDRGIHSGQDELLHESSVKEAV